MPLVKKLGKISMKGGYFLSYKIRVFNAIMYTMLAYMSCQIPAWLSKSIAYFFDENILVEVIAYFILVIITAVIIMFTVEDSAKMLLILRKRECSYGTFRAN